MSPSEQEEVATIFKDFFQGLTIETMTLQNKEDLHQNLISKSPTYKKLQQAMAKQANRLPTAGMLAGVYQNVDKNRGVWKSPANISLNSVISPTINITHEKQEDLNVATSGKSINTIRTFIGEGTLVWGVRTLEGNSFDWRYISVLRTVSMIKASVKRTLADFSSAPNNRATWTHTESIINDFLKELFQQGALAGATSSDAFSVRVGLGSTMTATDILEGKMNVSILIAVTRPAEFIQISLQQEMMK